MSVQFETRPVRGSRGPNRAMLLALGLVAFVALAIVKPWDSSRPAATAVAAPTAGPSAAAAVPSIPTATAAPAGAPGETDWTPELTSILQSHGPEIAREVSLGWQLGIRAITRKGLFAGTTISTAPLSGSMLEWWYPASGGRASGWDTAPIAMVQPSTRAPVLALGVTAGVGDDALDVRFWRVTDSGIDRLAPIEVSGPGAADRLFLPPAILAPDGGWPDGRYVAEVLLGSGIVAIPFRIGQGEGPPLPRIAPYGLMPQAGAIADALSGPGAFLVDGFGGITVEPVAPIARLDPVRAWLAVGDPPSAEAPRVARFREAAPMALGATLPDGSVLQSASLWGVSPIAAPMDAVRLVNPVGSATPFVAFTRADGGRWPAGTYRITARFWDSAYRLTERSWHLDFGTDPDAPVPLLLTGAGRWASVAGHWAVLSTVGSAGTNRTVGETLANAREPEVEAMRPAELGTMCPGSAHIDQASRLIGVAFPPDAGVSALRLVRRYVDGSSRLLDVPSALLPATGLALFAAPSATHGTWAEGYYDIEIALSPGLPQFLPLCIGRDAGSSYLFRVEPRSGVAPGAGAATVVRGAAGSANEARTVHPVAAYAGPGGVMASGAMLKP